jgi:hypothetical protein
VRVRLAVASGWQTDRKSPLALRGVGRESEAESMRFHGRRVTSVRPEVKLGLFRVAGRAHNPKKLPPELGAAQQGMRKAHSGAAGRFRWRRTPFPVRTPGTAAGRPPTPS